ncbi:MAG: dienelactone hydrolase family protein, partial [Chitinophagaceae bacterium]
MKNLILILVTFFTLQNTHAQLKPVPYSDGNQKLNGFGIAAQKSLKSKPGVLILPAWKGIDSHSKDVAQQLSELNYTVFIADIYGEGNYPKNPQEASEQSGYYKTNFNEYQNRIQLALNELIKSGAHADNIVIIGYCFGGTGALEAARGNLKTQGVVSFHGGLGKDAKRPNNAISPKVLILHGADDPYVSQESITQFQNEMREGKADWQMIYYANAVHAFTEISAGNDNSKGAAYNEKAWEKMELLLDKHLPEKKKKRRFIFLLFPLVLTGLGILFFFRQQNPEQPAISDKQITVTTDKTKKETGVNVKTEPPARQTQIESESPVDFNLKSSSTLDKVSSHNDNQDVLKKSNQRTAEG